MVTIKEAALLTGITRQNIRYYEKWALYTRAEKRKINIENIIKKISVD